MDPVIIRDYDPLWPRLFDALRARIATALEGLADAIEHVGSTAVPGLAAKPIIDMDALLASDAALRLAIARLGAIGYRYEGDLGVIGREAFRAPAGDCQHHLYICLPSSPAYSLHIAFRDYLRTHRQEADAYAALKRSLAAKYRDDGESYAQGKSEFVREILKRAVPGEFT